MIHARKDYNRIQDPTNKIAEDEPVFLLRAQDVHAPYAVRAWAEAAIILNPEMGRIANDWADKMEQWQDENGSKLPDL